MPGPTVRHPYRYEAAPRRTRRRSALRILTAAIAFLISTASAFADDQVPSAEPKVSITPRDAPRSRSAPARSSLRVDVNQILVPVTVTDSWDRPITSLPADSFRIFEDNVEQKIVSVFKEEGPISVGFLFDASSSMRKRMAPSLAAIEQFLKTGMPGDEYFLVRFSDKPTLVTRFTPDPDQILKGLSFIQPEGWTAMLDALCLGVQHMKFARNSRRALIVLTDGGDNNSRYTESEIRSLVRESDVRVYAIGVFERSHYLEKIAAETGGKAFFVHKLEDLPETIERLSSGFRNQYVLGYTSNNQQKDGKYRRVRVELDPATRQIPLNVVWRRGYYPLPE